MENMVETPSKKVPTIVDPECKTPTPPIEQQLHKPSNELRNLVSPVHLKLPKPFKYPERYVFLHSQFQENLNRLILIIIL